MDKLCSAFLWSGPSLNPNKAKVSWSEVCNPKHEGGLGLRSIEEANKVCILKLIWRIMSSEGSLWVDWVKRYLIRRGSFWAVKDTSTGGSWIWKKILKYREKAKHFYRVEVETGKEHLSGMIHGARWDDSDGVAEEREPVRRTSNRQHVPNRKYLV